VLEGVLPAAHAHVGTARRAVLDLAASRFLGAGRPRGIVASADADSIVAPSWVASTIAEMNRADAVAGAVEIEPRERERMLAPLRLLYDRELAYRRLLGEIEERFDPRPFDPAPRHDAFVAASFAVAAETYRDAAGLPGLPRLEDLAFSHALRRIDARVRHSYAVRVATSARRLARVDGGFGTFVGELELRSSRGETFFVRAAASTIAEAQARAALRRIRRGAAEESDADVARKFFNLQIEALRDIVAGAASFGSAFEHALEAGAPRLYRDEPVESAITALREALTWRNPAVPTRASAASGAG
jgi:hypothetical protein